MNSSKLNNLEADLSNTSSVTFDALLKALFAKVYALRNLSPHNCSAPHDKRAVYNFKGTAKFVDTHMQLFAKSAAEFCNGTSPHALELKECLREGLSQDDLQKRTESIANGLNATLLAYSAQQLGDLPHVPGKSDLIYVTSRVYRATEGETLTIAGTTVETLGRLSSAHERTSKTSLKPWVKRLHTKAWRRSNDVCRLPWRDLWHCWDIAGTPCSTSVEFRTCYPSTILGLGESGLDSAPSPSLSPPSRKRKAACDNDNTPSPKRRKTSEDGHRIELDPEIQYDSACNGLQMLCSTWDRIHSFNMTLQDNWLSLKWYDSQGCIATEPIDVVTQLPLLVMALALFQRFTPQMHGKAALDLSLAVDGSRISFEIPEEARPQWQLKGRHTVFATPVPKGTASRSHVRPWSSRITRSRAAAEPDNANQALLDDLYLKLSWRDERRTSEAHIIATAKERATHYLPNPEHVTKHLPDVKMAEEYDIFSTRHIRRSLGLETLGSRTPSLLVMQKLTSLDVLEPAKFKSFIWEIIRCLRLLWQIGVAHGDLSFWNMMHSRDGNRHKAVLIDFDHAMIMEPGSRTPPTSSLEPAGTLPFIAMEMGTQVRRIPFQRQFRHDLESVLWCMLWYCQEQPDWLQGSFARVCGEKHGWYLDHRHDRTTLPPNIRKGSEHLWNPIVDVLVSWMQADYVLPEQPEHDRDWLDIINDRFTCPRSLGKDWMSFEIPRSRIRRKDRLEAR